MAGWAFFLIYKWRKCNSGMLINLSQVYGPAETHFLTLIQGPTHPMKKFCVTWAEWSSRKKSGRAELHVTGRKLLSQTLSASRFNCHPGKGYLAGAFSSLPALMRDWRGPAQTACLQGDGGLLEAEAHTDAQTLSMRLALPRLTEARWETAT